MSLKLKHWNAAEFIRSEDEGRMLLEEIVRDGSAEEIADGIEAVARARGMYLLARELGISREQLFDLVNPWDEKFDAGALREMADRLVAGRPADAAE
jgi:probable addiction module antidote protein